MVHSTLFVLSPDFSPLMRANADPFAMMGGTHYGILTGMPTPPATPYLSNFAPIPRFSQPPSRSAVDALAARGSGISRASESQSEPFVERTRWL